MILDLVQFILAICLIVIILIQAKGTGLGSTFGGSSQMYHSKRGMEKIIFTTTIVLALVFTLVSIINLKL